MPAGIGNYAYYDFVETWPELAIAIYELEMRLRIRMRRPDLADRLLEEYGVLRDAMLELAIRASLFATEELKRSEHDTRVRPDTQGDGGPRLEDFLEAKPVGPQNLVPGSIGVANEDLLDANVPWWITNEIGNSTNVGRILYGFFYGADDEAPPDMTQFRVHPLFAPGWSPVSGRGIISNPIPARRFIARAVPKIDSYWKQNFRAAKDRFDGEMGRIIALARLPP
jgi:hypothetical protein